MSEIIRIVAIAAHMLLAFGIIILVLAHSGKDAGLSGAFGVGSSSFGSTQIMERNLTRFTIFCSVGFVCTTIILGFIL
ncbi:MAG TPA: preprotein translocase subunit SecG [Gaiellales bacterium]|nr:preprotein translocase subunit SecG [Gaiellales bacterium]